MTIYRYKTINVTLASVEWPYADISALLQRLDDVGPPEVWTDVDTYTIQIDVRKTDQEINQDALAQIKEYARQDARVQEHTPDIPSNWENYEFDVEVT